jgi:hypothetical protein
MCICNSSSLQGRIHLHFFNQDHILLLSALSLTPSHPTVFSLLASVGTFSNLEAFEFYWVLIPTFPDASSALYTFMQRVWDTGPNPTSLITPLSKR